MLQQRYGVDAALTMMNEYYIELKYCLRAISVFGKKAASLLKAAEGQQGFLCARCPLAGLGLMPLWLDNVDFIFADNHVVATEDTTIAEFIETASDDGGCYPEPLTFVTSAVAIAVVHNVANAP